MTVHSNVSMERKLRNLDIKVQIQAKMAELFPIDLS